MLMDETREERAKMVAQLATVELVSKMPSVSIRMTAISSPPRSRRMNGSDQMRIPLVSVLTPPRQLNPL